MAEIDVIVPAHDAARFVAETVAAIRAQTLAPRRVIVVDDGSRDDTAAVVGAIAAQDARVALVRQDNRGPSAARNAGLAASDAALVAFCDADDVWAPGKLAAQHALLARGDDPALGVVYCAYDTTDEAGATLDDPDVIRPSRRGDIAEVLLLGNLVTGSASAALVRRDCFATCGPFDEGLRAAEDWDMWLRIAQRYRFDFVDEVLVHIRRHPGSIQRDSKTMAESELRFLAKHACDIVRVPQARLQARERVAGLLKWYRRQGALAAGLAAWEAAMPPEFRHAIFDGDWDMARAMAGQAYARLPTRWAALRRVPKVARMLGRIKLARRRMQAGAP